MPFSVVLFSLPIDYDSKSEFLLHLTLAAPLVFRLKKRTRGLSPPPNHGSTAQRTGPENIRMGSGLHEDQPVQLPASTNGEFSNVL